MLNSKTVTFCEKVYIPLKWEIVFTPPFKIHCRYAYFSACKIQLLRWYNIASYNHTIFSCYNHSFALHDHGDHGEYYNHYITYNPIILDGNWIFPFSQLTLGIYFHLCYILKRHCGSVPITLQL